MKKFPEIHFKDGDFETILSLHQAQKESFIKTTEEHLEDEYKTVSKSKRRN